MSSVSTAGKLFRGALWAYGAQIITVLVQVAYAAVTSRAVDSAGFGAYSVALTAVGLFTLISSGGLAQTVGRLRDRDEHELGAICTYAVLMGLTFGVLTYIAADLVSRLWGVPESTPIIKILAVNALIAPIFGVAAGLMRRRGEFRLLAIATVLCNLLGMAVGTAAVLRFQTAESLVVSAVAGQVTLALVTIWIARSAIRFEWIPRKNEAVGFSGRVIGSSLIQYVIGNAPRFAASNVLGAPALGQWNRAEVLATLPFQQLQTALVPVVYPEFRHDRDDAGRSYAVWADMLALLAWVTVPLGALGGVVLPKVIPFVFGSHWDNAGLYAIPLALAGGLQPVVVLLASAIEAIGEFRIIWITNGLMLIAQLLLASAVVWFHSLWPAVVGLLISHVLSHLVYGSWAARRGLLDLASLRREYANVLAVSIVVSGSVALVLYPPEGAATAGMRGVGGMALLAMGVLAIYHRERLRPVVIARRRGLIGGNS